MAAFCLQHPIPEAIIAQALLSTQYREEIFPGRKNSPLGKKGNRCQNFGYHP